MITALIFFLILLVLVLIHEFGHYYAAKKNGVYVEEFGFGFPPKLFGKKIGETFYSFNALPLGGFVKLFGEEYHEEEKLSTKEKIPLNRAFVNKKPWQKTIIIVAGVVMNFLLGWAIYSYLLIFGIPTPSGVAVESVQKNSPAFEAGLKKNDQIIEASYKDQVKSFVAAPELVAFTKQFAGEKVNLKIQRGKQNLILSITPRKNPPNGQGSLGIMIKQEIVIKKYPVWQAPYYGFIETASTTKRIAVEILKLPMQLFSEKPPAVEFAGPIGIAQYIGEARQYGINAVLQITALLSLNLAVINILPFPALDGGRLVFIIFEWVTGKRSNQSIEKYMNIFGFIALLSLSLIVTINDLLKLWGMN
jgi:regulator of sigma E protease